MNENDDNEFDAALMDLAKRLPESVAPKRDLWPDIEQGIASSAPVDRSARQPFWMQAAAVLLLVGASSALTYSVVKNDVSDGLPVAGVQQELVFAPVSGSFGSQYNLGPDYQDARRDLLSRLEAGLQEMDPETRADIESNIETIRNAIADINLALDEEPDNVLLQELLLDTYQDELSLMRRIDGISNTTMRRDDI